MAYWKLSEKIWWGDRASPEETRREVLSVMSVAHNMELADKPHRNPYKALLPHHKPYIWLPRPDETPIDDWYLFWLEGSIKLCLEGKNLPFLVHCWGGHHRSPHVAVFAQLMLDGFTKARYAELLSKAHAIRGGLGDGAYSRTLREIIVKRCGDR